MYTLETVGFKYVYIIVNTLHQGANKDDDDDNDDNNNDDDNDDDNNNNNTLERIWEVIMA